MPQTDSARNDLFERNMGEAVVNLYMLHSDANEPDRPEKNAVKTAVFTGMSNMILEITGVSTQLGEAFVEMLSETAMNMIRVPVESMCEDKTTATDGASVKNRTDDLSLVLHLQAPQQLGTGIERPMEESVNPQKVLRDGQIYILRGEKMFTLQGVEVK